MPEPVLTATSGITLLGGADISLPLLELALSVAPVVVAADGGADRALALGVRPELVIGDLDSLSPAGREAMGNAVLEVTEQDTTDFEKCLQRLAAPFVLGLGFLGGRLDHALAALTVLTRAPVPVLLIGEEDVVFCAPSTLTLRLPVGTRLSLYPLAPVRGRSEGLVWPIDGIDFAPAGRVGTSNRTDGEIVRLSFTGRGMLVLLPRQALRAALSALLSAEPHVPGVPDKGPKR
ncbi:thiamine pyrophosphokinase [Haematobacter missouriensis]|uniref:Thiamine diphosphokinase n=1 Tax=Haematobacter missouriensis TaxID=366616 RepID=A0A212AWZ4_9RHOB|nr:thiamine diphosphokinase [Haematobacter missouriensis]KFI34275.1 thiamine pyrophosphokinase [Haematobacter missouriensis]OWJ78257.1 thiamine pyrophosphokinase [Haematobacter missouriensis]OWJ86007.1 thiamine pyrophosphokinase [Haematobacter missouriensis]